jgi:small subunit ribosomal protein S20
MPLIKSAIKKMRQDKKKTARNRLQKDSLKNAIKAVADQIRKKEVAGLAEALRKAYQAIDKATKKHLLHKNTAARKKSHLARLVKVASKK